VIWEGQKIRIAIFGGADCTDAIGQLAKEVGKLLAKKDIIVYCGGKTGVMEAVSKGVVEMGGIVVGILPDDNGEDANKYITIPVATGAGSGRNVMIANSVHGAIAINGSYGTLSEIGHTLRQGKPVVGLETWDIDGIEYAETPEEAVDLILDLI